MSRLYFWSSVISVLWSTFSCLARISAAAFRQCAATLTSSALGFFRLCNASALRRNARACSPSIPRYTAISIASSKYELRKTRLAQFWELDWIMGDLHCFQSFSGMYLAERALWLQRCTLYARWRMYAAYDSICLFQLCLGCSPISVFYLDIPFPKKDTVHVRFFLSNNDRCWQHLQWFEVLEARANQISDFSQGVFGRVEL